MVRKQNKILKIRIAVIQKVVRLGLKIPVFNNIVWRYVCHIREFFGRENDIDMFQTTFDDSIKMWVSLSDHIESQIFWQGVQEGDRGEVILLKSILKPDQVFFDIGAHIGTFTLIAAKHLKKGKVHAFEPSQRHLKKLYENVRTNDFQNVVINPIGLSNATSHRQLYTPKIVGTLRNTGLASLHVSEDLIGNYDVEDIKTSRLDDYVETNDIQRMDVVKIDVEGAELEVLEGGQRSIDTFRPLVMMEVNKDHIARAGRGVKDILNFWNHFNYDVFIIRNNGKLVRINGLLDLKTHQNIFAAPEQLR